MEVYSKRDTKRLNKGQKYEIDYISNDKEKSLKEKGYFYASLSLKGISGYYSPNSFTLLDGSNLPKINWESSDSKYKKQLYAETSIYGDAVVKVGDILICKNESSKFLISGKKYKVSASDIAKKRIKVDGYDRWLSIYSFRFCSKQEIREMSLGSFLSGIAEDLSINTENRYIDTLDDITRNELLVKILFKSFLDVNRHGMSIIEWAVRKGGSKYSLTEGDFKDIGNLKLKTLLNKFE